MRDDDLVEANKLLNEIEKRENWERWKYNPKEFFEECLKIYPKDSALGLIPFILNGAQCIALELAERQMKTDGMVRIINGKYRQAGFSTLYSGYIFHRALFFDNTSSVIIAHDAITSESIFAMSQTFWNNLPKGIQPALKKANVREMSFENNNSGFRVFTAGSDETGRGITGNSLLADEVAFWKKGKKVIAGLFQAISNSPGSIIIINSTSNGAQGVYYDLWCKAEKGEGSFTPLFVPWHIQQEYRTEVPDGLELTLEEKHLVKKYDLDLEQVYWRRLKISDTDTNTFKQEYPFTAEESFIQSGQGVFDTEALSKYMPEEPTNIMEYDEGLSHFQEKLEGSLKVWEAPDRNKKYIIAADVAQGLGGDYSVAVVLSQDREVVAVYRNNRIEPARFGSLLFYLGRWYNNGLVCPERNSIGLTTVQQLFSMNYPNLYKQKKTANVSEDSANVLGFYTSTATKAPIIANLQTLIKDFDIKVPDGEMLQELKDYLAVTTDSGNTKMQAAPGKYDDRVMALAIACEVYRTDGQRLTNNPFSFSERNSFSSYVDDTKWL